ncbi:MAG: thiamine-phosphate kinase [Acidimicrobiia bacterium]
MVGEFEFLTRLRDRLPHAPEGQLWSGDDAAVLANGLLAATDALVDNVHFRLSRGAPADVGWKSIAVNVSDLAAMGGTPTAALAAVALPPDLAVADALVDGMIAACEAFGCPLVGGDLTTAPVAMIAVAALGQAPATGPVTRAGARPGDTVFVTGSLGAAAGALHAIDRSEVPHPEGVVRLDRPVARLAEGQAAARAGARAMIDVSDGFAQDLGHICDESGVGVRVDAEAVPVGPGATIDDALAGGDDYELVFCAPDPDAVRAAFVAAGLAPPSAVGTIVEGGRTVVVDGREQALGVGGWEHQL